jgi:hypothetical protein
MNGEPGNREGLANAALNCAAGLAVFALACTALHWVVPWPHMDEISSKLKYFTQHKDEFDTLFFGSSRVFRGVFPQEFDAAVKQNGGETHSFNLGIDGMMIPESYFWLEKILALKPARLKWVFVELTPLWTKIDADKKETMRAVYWHDWLRTCWVLRDIRENLPPKAKRAAHLLPGKFSSLQQIAELSAMHLALFARNFGNVGRGFDLMREKNGTGRTALDASLEKSSVPLSGALPYFRKDKMAGSELAGYLDSLATLRARAGGHARAGRAFREATDRALGLVRGARAQPVFFIAPTTSPARDFFSGKTVAPLFAFNDPERFALFYQPDHRADYEHLNEKAAREFSALFGAQFGKFLAGKK